MTDFHHVYQHVVSRIQGALSASLQGVVLGHKGYTQSLCSWCYSIVCLTKTFVFVKHKNNKSCFPKKDCFFQFKF
jgi:hypothetical protein